VNAAIIRASVKRRSQPYRMSYALTAAGLGLVYEVQAGALGPRQSPALTQWINLETLEEMVVALEGE
jgi:hypothetical protein